MCTAAATGAGSVNLGAVPVTYGPTTPHNVGPYTATGTFTAANNYAGASGSGSFSITAAPTTTAVTCTLTTVVYTGSAQTPCSVAVTGPGLSLTPTPIYSANTDVGTVTASYTYPAAGNYLGSSDSKQFSITQATSLATVVCPSTATVFTGAALTPCTASVTGAGSLNLPLTAFVLVKHERRHSDGDSVVRRRPRPRAEQYRISDVPDRARIVKHDGLVPGHAGLHRSRAESVHRSGVRCRPGYRSSPSCIRLRPFSTPGRTRRRPPSPVTRTTRVAEGRAGSRSRSWRRRPPPAAEPCCSMQPFRTFRA